MNQIINAKWIAPLSALWWLPYALNSWFMRWIRDLDRRFDMSVMDRISGRSPLCNYQKKWKWRKFGSWVILQTTFAHAFSRHIFNCIDGVSSVLNCCTYFSYIKYIFQKIALCWFLDSLLPFFEETRHFRVDLHPLLWWHKRVCWRTPPFFDLVLWWEKLK